MPTKLRRAAAAFLIAQLSAWSATPAVVAQPADGSVPESAGPEYKSATQEEQLNLLRRLLGVEVPAPQPAAAPEPPPPEPVAPAVAPPPAPTPVEQPTAAEPAAAPPAKPAKPAAAPPAKPAAKPKPAPKPNPVAKPKPATKPAPRPAAKPQEQQQEQAQEPQQDQPQTAPAPSPQEPSAQPGVATEAAAPAPAAPPPAAVMLPPVGTIITAANVEQWRELLPPSVRWSVYHGVPLEVAAPKRFVSPPARVEATERYSAQVKLSEDRKSMRHYVAGIPFPYVTEQDPDAAIKLMFNFESALQIDDVDGRNFSCVTGGIDAAAGVQPERNYSIEHFRRLFHTGRLYVDPKPTWPTPENIRYREMLGPLSEPFDLKGAGFTYNRYLDPARQDDSWLYFPQTRRVRRLSTAQRSEGVFGQDVDLDSYAGFAGNPAWFDWELLGKKTLLVPFQARHEPVKWAAKPGDFLFDDLWEPREIYIIAARSLLPGYNFSLRIIYVDAESLLIPYTEVYDHNGQLWRAYIQQTKINLRKPVPYARQAVYDFDNFFIQAISVFDMQQQHATFCQWPGVDAPKGEEVWYYWWGDKSGGSRPEDFDVATLIQMGR